MSNAGNESGGCSLQSLRTLVPVKTYRTVRLGLLGGSVRGRVLLVMPSASLATSWLSRVLQLAQD